MYLMCHPSKAGDHMFAESLAAILTHFFAHVDVEPIALLDCPLPFHHCGQIRENVK